MQKGKKRHYVYKIENIHNGKFYIGKHSCYGEFLNSDYWGSGTNIRIAIQTSGKEHWKRMVLSEHPSSIAAYKSEERLVTEKLLSNKLCLNLCLGGQTPFSKREKPKKEPKPQNSQKPVSKEKEERRQKQRQIEEEAKQRRRQKSIELQKQYTSKHRPYLQNGVDTDIVIIRRRNGQLVENATE